VTEPRRWLEDPEAPSELRELLERVPRGRALDSATRVRLGGRIARYAAIPLSAAAWLSVKSAAALGVAAGVATAGAVAVAQRTVLAPEAPAVEPRPSEPSGVPIQRRAAPPIAHEPISPPSPEVVAPVEPAPSLRSPKASVPAPSAPVSAAGGLAEESRLLEQARRALAAAPTSALELTREHARRFPKAQLGAERDLIELEALYRSGQRAAARARASQLLARGSDGLYAERLRVLALKIEAGR
jgi:hypothetical protein